MIAQQLILLLELRSELFLDFFCPSSFVRNKGSTYNALNVEKNRFTDFIHRSSVLHTVMPFDLLIMMEYFRLWR